MSSLRPFEIIVKTLTGLSLPVLVSPLDTVASLKHRLCQMQGIPPAQQQIVWQSRVLDDDVRLTESGIGSHSVVHLLVALRGGPLNSNRRLSGMYPVDDAEFVLEFLEGQDDCFSDLADAVTPVDELFDRFDYLPGGERGSVLLMFQDSDSGEISIFRVCPERDYSPLSEAADESPLRTASPSSTDESSRRSAGGPVTARLSSAGRRTSENEQTREKMRQLRSRMDAVRSLRHSIRAISRSRAHDAAVGRSEQSRLGLLAGRPALHDEPRRSVLDQRTLGPTPMRASGLEWACAEPTPSPQGLKNSTLEPSNSTRLPLLKHLVDNRTSAPRLERRSSSHREDEIDGAPSATPCWLNRGGSRASCLSRTSKKRCQHRENSGPTPDTPLTTALQRLALHDNSTTEKVGKEESATTKHGTRHKSDTSSVTSLPPLRVPRSTNCPSVPTASKQSTRRQRCSVCTKKLGLATTFTCRCGLLLCAQHRYPETHRCTFDYKGTGREVLRHQNPVVTAVKLPKI